MSVRTPDPDPTPDLPGDGVQPGPAWLSDIELEQVRRRLPLLYVEAVPVRVDGLGQVSEVGRLDQDDSDTPISPGDSTAGYPESESGDPDTRGTGPDAIPPENRRDQELKDKGKRPAESVEDE